MITLARPTTASGSQRRSTCTRQKMSAACTQGVQGQPRYPWPQILHLSAETRHATLRLDSCTSFVAQRRSPRQQPVSAAPERSWWSRWKAGFTCWWGASTQPRRDWEQFCGCQLQQRGWSIVESCDEETEQHSGSWICRGCSTHETTWLPRTRARRRTTICLTSFIPVY